MTKSIRSFDYSVISFVIPITLSAMLRALCAAQISPAVEMTKVAFNDLKLAATDFKLPHSPIPISSFYSVDLFHVLPPEVLRREAESAEFLRSGHRVLLGGAVFDAMV